MAIISQVQFPTLRTSLRLSGTILLSFIFAFTFFIDLTKASSSSTFFDESLTIRPLQDGRVHVIFKFDLSSPLNLEEKKSNQLPIYSFVPRSLIHLAQSSNVEDVRLAINAGRWDYNRWGIPLDEQMVGTGAEVRAKLRNGKSGKDQNNAFRDWRSLTANMAGLFCASLDALDEKLTVEPFNEEQGDQFTTLHAMLSSESICTENLSTLLKLLPCKTMAGLSSLLKPHRFFLSDFHGMMLHMYRDEGAWKVQIHVQAVFSPALAPSRRGKRDWSLEKLFGTKLKQSCPLVRNSWIKVLSPSPQESNVRSKEHEEIGFNVWPIVMTPSDSQDIDEDESLTEFAKLMKKAERFALELRKKGSYTFDTLSSTDLNVEMTWPKEQYYSYPPAYTPQKLSVSRIFSGNGQERGKIQLSITNLEQARERRVIYREVLPWFIKVYLHTIQEKIIEEIEGNDESIVLFTDDLNTPVIQSLNYTPSIPRERPTQLQVQLRIPPLSTVHLTFEYDKAFLRYAEHPPDAHRGFDVAPAIVTLEDGIEIYTEAALVEVAVPDFSMPYNVIIFTSTLIALCAGSTLNNLIRKYTDVIEVESSK